MSRFEVSAWPVVVCALILAACAQSPSQPVEPKQPEAKELPIPPKYKDSVEKEFALGKELKTYDDVAWIGTDAIEAVGYKRKPGVKGGFVVEPMDSNPDGLYLLSFINEIDGKPMVVAVAEINHDSGMGHVVGAKVLDIPTEPSSGAKELYQALDAARSASDLKLCQATYNSVVVPYAEDGTIDFRVYLLMSTTKKGEAPYGGHALIRVGSDAKTVLQIQPLAKSCMVAEGVDDPKVVSLVFSDLALDYPSAAQVFIMLRYERPVYLATRNGLLWVIESKGIRLLDRGNQGLDQARVTRADVPTWLVLSDNGANLQHSQAGCTTTGQCDIDPADLPKGAAMVMVTHLPAATASTTGGGAADLQTKAIALSPEVPGAGDWGPLASGMVGAILTPNSAHYAIEGSRTNPRARYLGGGDEKLGKYAAEHWHGGMTNNDVVHMLETYLTQSGQQP